MREPEPDSPFAVCAEPKPSAVEYLKRRREADARFFREQASLWGSLLLACPALAFVGASLHQGIVAMPAAYAFLGALAGLVSGLLVGWISWAVLRATRRAETARAVADAGPWDAGAAYVAFWAGIGVVLGSGYGAMAQDAAYPWALGGSALGAILAFFTWFLWLRGAAARRASSRRG